jgi:hypothetical protein
MRAFIIFVLGMLGSLAALVIISLGLVRVQVLPGENATNAAFHDTSVVDPDPWSVAILTLGIRDPGWVKKSGSGSGMNNPYHISKSLETVFLGLKNT